MIEELNLKLFSLINADVVVSNWKMNFAIFSAEYLIYFIPILLVGFWLWGNPKHRPVLLYATFITFIALLANQLISLVWLHPRPFMMGIGHTFLKHVPNNSFPSDHMTVFWAIGITLFYNLGTRFVGLGTLIVSILVSWARIFLGVHFPFDMLGAIVISTTCFFSFTPIKPWFNDIFLPLIEKRYNLLVSKIM